jgi:hypothetical protein
MKRKRGRFRRPAWLVLWLRAERARRRYVHEQCRRALQALPAHERLDVAAAALAQGTYGYTVREALVRAQRAARAYGRRTPPSP